MNQPINENKLVNEAIAQGAVPEGWQEKTVDFFKFENIGDCIQGRLTKKTLTTINGNAVGRYTVYTAKNKFVAFLGSVQLDQIMADIAPGQNSVYIQLIGSKKTGRGMDVREFRVLTKSYIPTPNK